MCGLQPYSPIDIVPRDFVKDLCAWWYKCSIYNTIITVKLTPQWFITHVHNGCFKYIWNKNTTFYYNNIVWSKIWSWYNNFYQEIRFVFFNHFNFMPTLIITWVFTSVYNEKDKQPVIHLFLQYELIFITRI